MSTAEDWVYCNTNDADPEYLARVESLARFLEKLRAEALAEGEAKGREAEREACARECEASVPGPYSLTQLGPAYARRIRARGQGGGT